MPGNFTETELGEINFPEISSPILEKICEYFYYKLRYQNEYVPSLAMVEICLHASGSALWLWSITSCVRIVLPLF